MRITSRRIKCTPEILSLIDKSVFNANISAENAKESTEKLDAKKKIYISLPITGRELSEAKAQAERVSSMWEDDENYRAITPFDICTDPNMEYSQCMGKCIEVLLECDAIYMASGWINSKGCNAEFQIAKIYGKKIIE